MDQINRLSYDSGWIDLDFVEREETPKEVMEMGIHLHLAGLSLSNTVEVLESMGVDRCRATVHNWVHKADLEPSGGVEPDYVAVDETVIQLNDERYWLYVAVDPTTNYVLHARLYPTRNSYLTKRFLKELEQKHDIENSTFLIDQAPWLKSACHQLNLHFQHSTHGKRNSVERLFKKLKRRLNQFSNHFRNSSHHSAESWLLAKLQSINHSI
ncbi:MAG: IS6 family transposase [Halobacteria archaeon]|nr:IS6 family transposase [Halobacteria archaeon]